MHRPFGAVIPARNEAAHIAAVLDGVKRHVPPDRIIVVDDGSTDATAAAAEAAGACVISHRTSSGKGVALRTGFERLMTYPEIEAVFTIDADGQHDPDEIPSFIERFRRGHVDILIGSRMARTGGMPMIRLLTNRFTSAVISLRTRCRIDDSQSGYRLIRTSLLRDIDFVTGHFDFESELLIKAALRGAVIASVPIRTIYLDEKSKINPLRDTARFFMLVVRSLFW
jgi:glycosyltransferase involved in cell wall biosynthesis